MRSCLHRAALVLWLCGVSLAPAWGQPAPTEPPPPLSAPPALRTMLPQDALAYVRLPTLWGLLSAPKGNLMHTALTSPVIRHTWNAVAGALAEQLRGPLQAEIGPLPGLVLDQLRAPVEVVILRPTAGLFPDVLVLLQLQSDTPEAVNAVLQAVAKADLDVQVEAPLDAQGQGRLRVLGLPVLAAFDATSRRLVLLTTQDAAPTADPAPTALAQRLQRLQPRPEAPMLALEAEIDSSGQGAFLWLDTKTIFEVAQGVMPPPQRQQWLTLGGAELRQVAAGMGVSQGKGRLKLVVDMPKVGWRTLLPTVSAPLGFAAAGTPAAVVLVNLPSAQDWQQAEAFVRPLVPAMDAYLQPFKDGLQTATGLSLAEWLTLFGPEMAYVHDAAGQYSVLRMRNPGQFATLLELLQQRYGFRAAQRTIEGQTYGHLILPDLITLATRFFPDLQGTVNGLTPAQQWFLRWILAFSGHLYWKLEGEYLLMASLPHVLMDRDRLSTKTPVRAWLTDTQKLPGEDALLLASTQIEGIPQMMYTLYLLVLRSLGDVTGRPVDMFTLPSALEVQLPTRGSYGLKVASTATRLALEATYESHLLEWFVLGGSMQSMMLMGMASAALSFPRVMEARKARDLGLGPQLAQVDAFKDVMAEFYAAQQRFPTEDEIPEVFVALEDAPIAPQIEIEPDTGVIVLYAKHPQLEDNNRVSFRPTAQDGTVQWTCQAEFAAEYPVPECR